jgi:hypothetical protein
VRYRITGVAQANQLEQQFVADGLIGHVVHVADGSFTAAFANSATSVDDLAAPLRPGVALQIIVASCPPLGGLEFLVSQTRLPPLRRALREERLIKLQDVTAVFSGGKGFGDRRSYRLTAIQALPTILGCAVDDRAGARRGKPCMLA